MIEKGKRRRKSGSDFLAWILVMALAVTFSITNVRAVLAEPLGEGERLASDSNGNENTAVKDGETTATDSNAGQEYGPGMDSGKQEKTQEAVEGEAGPGYETEEQLASDSNAEPLVYQYEGNGISVNVLLPAGVELPEGAVLQVKLIAKETEPERFALRCSQFQEKWSGDAPGMKIYDIGFYTETGEHVELDQKAVVSFDFGDEPLEVEGGLSVIHFKTGGPEFAEIVDAVTDGEKKVWGITFRTNGFSDFGFMNSGIMPIAGGPGTGGYTLAGALFLLSAGLLYKYERGGKGGKRLTDAQE